METVEKQIVLADKTFTFKAPIELGVLKHVDPALFRMRREIIKNEGMVSTEAYDYAIEAITLTLRKDNPEIARKTLEDLPISRTQLRQAVDIIVEASSMYEQRSLPEGEAQGEVSPSNGG